MSRRTKTKPASAAELRTRIHAALRFLPVDYLNLRASCALHEDDAEGFDEVFGALMISGEILAEDVGSGVVWFRNAAVA